MEYKVTANTFGAINREFKRESTLKEKGITRGDDLSIITFDLCEEKGLSVKIAITEEIKSFIGEIFKDYNHILEDNTITITEEIHFGGSTGKRKDRDSINYYNPDNTKGITIKREEDRTPQDSQ